MTRSNESRYSPKVAKKAFRQSARASGLTYPQAIATLKSLRGLDTDSSKSVMIKLPGSSSQLDFTRRTGIRPVEKRTTGKGPNSSGGSWNYPMGTEGNRENDSELEIDADGFPVLSAKFLEMLEYGNDSTENWNRDSDTNSKMTQPQTLDLASLIESARPRKAKLGLANQLEYEILAPGPTRRVIFLNDDISELDLGDFESGSDGLDLEGWEDLYDDFPITNTNNQASQAGSEKMKGGKMSYAAVLKTNG